MSSLVVSSEVNKKTRRKRPFLITVIAIGVFLAGIGTFIHGTYILIHFTAFSFGFFEAFFRAC